MGYAFLDLIKAQYMVLAMLVSSVYKQQTGLV
jgi:hypothetical protein